MATAPQPQDITPSSNTPTVSAQALTPAIIDKILANQADQLELERRNQDIQSKDQEIRLREIDATSTYSESALKAQLTDRANARQHELAMKRTRYAHWLVALGGGSVLFTGGLIACVVYNQTALALDIVKMVVPPAITAISGYFIGMQKGRGKAKEEAAEAAEQK